MSRGPRSARALEAALPVASRRGEVMVFEQRTGSCFDFMTAGPAGPSAVRVDRALSIHGSPAQIAVAYSGTIDRMIAAALAPGISRELWLWAPWGTLRYFRIDGGGLTELDMLGNVRVPLVKGALAGKKRVRDRKSRKKSCASSELPAGPTTDTTTGTTPPASGSPALAPGTPREPAPVRYLRLRAAEMKRKTEKEGHRRPARQDPPTTSPGDTTPGGEDNPPS